MSFSRASAIAAIFLFAAFAAFYETRAEIPLATDAPQPLSPEESVKRFKVPDGFRLELAAAEPLVREPSGMCWDARGRLFVCELHGYNMDGQLDIDELNKSGQLDREVRRIRVSDAIKEAAKEYMYGTVKLLSDTDGDGRMDESQVFADHLPPCYGICPARDGIVAACAPDIVFLADRDGDGHAEVREILFTGFQTGPIERGINCPQWGLDDWIYIGRGHSGGKITGPKLPKPVELPRTDFRIKADGSAIEPILGATNTIGFASTERGERFVIWTYSPGIYVAPIEWRYLARNPDFAPGRLEDRLGDGRTYPASRPHPWRTRRAEDPGFAEFYTKRNGIKETSPNGYFTSACSPLIYQSDALPGLRGQLIVCEPAQNMIHRAIISRDGPSLHLGRTEAEKQSEFLTSTDQWFNPISLTHAPDGSVAIADFYREIIEDYSAIPRYLQQQYGLTNGKNHGRIWRLVHRDMPADSAADMSRLSPDQLVEELASSNFWRRQTAKRLLVEQSLTEVAAKIAGLVRSDNRAATVIGALYTLEALGKLNPELILTALASADPGVRIHGLRLSEPWLESNSKVFDTVLAMIADPDDSVVLQLALTLGESQSPDALQKLAELSRQRGAIRWMDTAVVSSLGGRAGKFLELLLDDESHLAEGREVILPLAGSIASRRDGPELSSLLPRLAGINDRTLLADCLKALHARAAASTPVALSQPAMDAINRLTEDSNRRVSTFARDLSRRLRVESTEKRLGRIRDALTAITDVQLSLDDRLAAIAEVENEDSPEVTRILLAAVADSTPTMRTALLEAIFSRQDRLADVIAALETKTFSASLLTALQRVALTEHPVADIRQRANKALETTAADNAEQVARYTSALKNERNVSRGREIFTKHCAACHQAHGSGAEVGPNLTAENKRAEETMIQDILAPSSSITAGYSTYIVTTTNGQILNGLLASESATSITLKRQEGKTQTILRKDIDSLKASPVSLMPDDLSKAIEPQDVADLLAWLKNAGSTPMRDRE
jgi:putative membrane-bound dehydrogenase-like protein